ncbi:MAG: hypothetical protein OES10_02360 [Gammaproteobacteria bacterium]|nr:hypothetical protein [Gammaproteobacteria bacterium]
MEEVHRNLYYNSSRCRATRLLIIDDPGSGGRLVPYMVAVAGLRGPSAADVLHRNTQTREIEQV